MSGGIKKAFRTFTLTVVGFASIALVAVGPAHALSTNTLLFEGNIAGTGPGGNLSDAQIQALIASNEAQPGWPAGQDIELVGKVNIGGAFEAETGFAGTFVSFDCNPVGAGGNDADCKTGFTVNFNFASTGEEWQIVKVAVKAGQQDHGVFFIDPALLQSGDLDPLQAGFVSDADRLLSCGNAVNNPNNANDDGCRGVSHLLVFATQTEPEIPQVPEPTTLVLLGLGLAGLGVARKFRK